MQELGLVAVTDCDASELAGGLMAAAKTNPWLADTVARKYRDSGQAIITLQKALTAARMRDATVWTYAITWDKVAIGCLTISFGRIIPLGVPNMLAGPRLDLWLAGREGRPAAARVPLLPTLVDAAFRQLIYLPLVGVPWCAVPCKNTYALDVLCKTDNAFGGFEPVGSQGKYPRLNQNGDPTRLWQLLAAKVKAE